MDLSVKGLHERKSSAELRMSRTCQLLETFSITVKMFPQKTSRKLTASPDQEPESKGVIFLKQLVEKKIKSGETCFKGR